MLRVCVMLRVVFCRQPFFSWGAGGGPGLRQQRGASYQNLLAEHSTRALLAAARPDIVSPA